MKKIIIGLVLMFSASFAYAGYGMGMAVGMGTGMVMGSAMNSGFTGTDMPMWAAILACIIVSFFSLALIFIIVDLFDWDEIMPIVVGSSLILTLVLFNIILYGLLFTG